MQSAVIDTPTITEVVAPITAAETDALLLLSASSEKRSKVHAGQPRETARAWQFRGAID